MAKKKDASSALVSGSAEALGLRRSGRETPSKKQATASPSNTRNSERSEKQTSPNPSPAKKKPEKIEKPTGPSPLRRSDRGKKLAEVSGLLDIKSKKKKTSNIAKHSAGDVNEVKENGRQDSNVSDRKRKKFTIRHYKALFQPQRIQLEIVEYKNPERKDKSHQANTSNNEACLDVDKELKSLEVVDQTVAADSVCQQMNCFTEGHKVSLNSRRVQGIPDKDQKIFMAGNSMVLQQVEHVGCPSQTKPNDGNFTESGNVEKQIGDNCSPSNKNLADGDNHISHTSSSMVNHDLENHLECDSCDKVTRTCKAVMVNAENDDAATNLHNSGNTCLSSKFVEFWVPVQISNVQLEQYCATLLSNAMTLRSSSKTDTLGALSDVFVSNRKCCNHPYLVDPHLEKLITKDLEPNMMLDASIKASGKLRFLDLILPEVKKRQQRALVLFQPTRGTLNGYASIGNILEDFVYRRFGQESYEIVDAFGLISSKKQAALNKFNKEMSRFIFLLESRACHQSIKLLSVDIIIIFDSDLIPATDLRALQKVNIDSQSEPIMIFRLYSSSTLEEKILKLAEQNVAIEIRSQTLRCNYDALLMWGALELFNKLTEFHTASVWSISADGSLTKDVVEEFLYIVSHKSKSRDSVKSLITRVQNFGVYGKNIPLHSEIKTHLPNGDQPHVFWRNLLEGRNPLWKFVPESTPRQRKRPNYFLDSFDEESGMDGGGVKTRQKMVISTIEPAQWKPVIEGGSRGINEGGYGPPVHNESQSSSGDPTAVSNEMSLHDLLKPKVSELCSVLKFSVNATIIVERFLEFVLENFRVGKEHGSTLQAFMISLCWIGASLAQYNIDRSESFALATKLLNFSCLYEEAGSVYKKLEQAKESFLQHTEILDALKECIRTPQEVKLNTKKCQHTQNVDVSENHESSNEEEADKYKRQMEDLARKVQNEINEFNKDWDEKRANLENNYNVDGALIRYLNSNNPSVRSEKLNILEKEYANKFDEHERLREIHLKDLKATLLAVNEELSLHVSQHETQVAPSLCENPIEAQSHDEPDHDTYVSIPNVTEGDAADKIESTRSHTPDKQMAGVTVSSEPVGEIPAQQNDDMEIDMAVADATVLSEPVAEVPAQQHDGMTGDVAVETDLAEMELLLVNSNQEHSSLGGNSPDRSHASKDGDETAPNYVVPDVDSEEMRMPGGNCDKENAEDRTISPDTLHAAEGNNEVSHNDVGSHVDSAEASTPADLAVETDFAEMELPLVDSNQEHASLGGNSPGRSHASEDGGETAPNDVVPDVDSEEMGMPGGNCDKENAEDRTISPDTLHAAEGNNEVSHNDVGSHVDSAEASTPADLAVETDLAEMELPLVDSNQEHASLGGNSPDRSHASEDGDETAPNDVVPDVDYEEMGMPGGNCDKENAEDRTISPDTLHAAEGNNEVSHNDVGSHVDSAEASMPADNYNEENIGDNDTRPDTSSHAFEDHNDLCGSNNNNSVSADVSLDETPLVQPSATLPSDHTMQTILEIENVSLQVQQPLDTGVQDKDGQVDLSSLAETTTGQITLEDSPLDPHNELILPSSMDPLVPENQSNILPLSGLLVEHSTEPTLVSQSGESLEEHLVAAETPLGEYESSLPSSDAPPLPPPINLLDMFANLNQMGARMPNHGDPLQAEVERLCTVNHNVTKRHEDSKQKLNSDCDKEITEAIAQIRLKYEAKHQEEDASFHARKKELDTILNRVLMNRILAEAFRAKCQDLTPFVCSGMQQVSPAGSMQQLHRVSGPSSMRRSPGTASTSPGQVPGSQQTTPPPPSPPRSLPPQPPLQIVHQPAAFFSITPSRPQHSTNLRPPSTTSIRPPPNTNPPIVNSMSTRPLSNTYSTSPSTAPTRPSPIVNTITPSITPTTSRPPPVINTITPSTTPTTSRLPPGINPITPSSTPSTSRPPPVSRPITPSSTSNRPSPGVNPINSTSTQNRSPYITNLTDMSAANLRINTETRGQTSHVRPVANGEARTPPPRMQSLPSSEIHSRAPHMRPAVSSESHAPAPHMRSMASSGIHAPAPHMRSVVSSEIRAPAPHIRPFRSTSDFATQRGMPQGPHIRPFRSQSPLPTSSQQLLPPLPPEASFVPQLPPPSSLPSTSSPLPHSSSHIPLQRIPSVTTSGGPSLASTDNLNVVMDNGARFLTPPDLSQFNFMDLTNVFQEGGTRFSGNDLVCLSDDE